MDKPTVTLSKVEQTIDLSEFTDVDLSDARSLKEQIGQALIDVIQSRTEDGRGYGGVKLKSPYSKSYTKSLEFKAAGKHATEVNMKLTGDMLASLDVEMTSGGLKVAVAPDQVPKAFNHLTGDTVPKRNWFGVTKKEVSEVMDSFKDDLRALADTDAPPEDQTSDTIKAIDFLKGDGFNPFGDDSED